METGNFVHRSKKTLITQPTNIIVDDNDENNEEDKHLSKY
jgi:hypothetical protein